MLVRSEKNHEFFVLSCTKMAFKLRIRCSCTTSDWPGNMVLETNAFLQFQYVSLVSHVLPARETFFRLGMFHCIKIRASLNNILRFFRANVSFKNVYVKVPIRKFLQYFLLFFVPTSKFVIKSKAVHS